MSTTASEVKPAQSGTKETQVVEEAVEASQEFVSAQLPAITGRVSRDVMGLAQMHPGLLAERGALLLTASYMAEQQSVRGELNDRITRLEDRCAALAEEVSVHKAERARLEEALQGERSERGPRNLVTALGGVLVGLGMEQMRNSQFALGAPLALLGAILMLIYVRRQSASSEPK